MQKIINGSKRIPKSKIKRISTKYGSGRPTVQIIYGSRFRDSKQQREKRKDGVENHKSKRGEES
jgi:hypothetical protein